MYGVCMVYGVAQVILHGCTVLVLLQHVFRIYSQIISVLRPVKNEASLVALESKNKDKNRDCAIVPGVYYESVP